MSCHDWLFPHPLILIRFCVYALIYHFLLVVLKKGGVPTLADKGHLLVGDTVRDEEPV